MRTNTQPTARRAQAGQTLVIALIVLGVLLAMGFVFLGIVGRNVAATAANQRRSQASELAYSGARYAHQQLLRSLAGADWRPVPTPVTPVSAADPNLTRDPDVLYIRPGTGYGLRSDSDPHRDLGGPDGLGPYTRVDTQGGRALIRVRYAPSDANVFIKDQLAALRNPGRSRMYTIIESVGRPGRVTFNDPTSLATSQAVQFQGYGSGADFRQALSRMKRADAQIAQSSKALAFASIPMLESLLYFSNLDGANRPAEIGIDPNLNVIYQGVDIATGRDVNTGDPATKPLSLNLGTPMTVFNFGNPPTPTLTPVGMGGSAHANTGWRIFGDVRVQLAGPLGDQWTTNDLFMGGHDEARLIVESSSVDASGLWQAPVVTTLQNGTNPSLNSRSDFFSTVFGLLRDGVPTSDANGYQRGIGTKQAPRTQEADPDTGQTRYRTMTRESGVVIEGINSGRYGHGRNVYVDNLADRQVRVDDQGRERLGTAESLVYDWLNPNNAQTGSGWVGPYYVPRGAQLLFVNDGFVIVRDARGPEAQRFWRAVDGGTPVDFQGNPVQTGAIRYRLGYDSNGQLKIVNTFTPHPTTPGVSIDINASSLDFDQIGQPFNGVLFFEGNVRVRGTIPTDIQLTVVSGATIYIEGSVTKGVVSFAGARLNRPSRSTLMLMAKDYVALNTTQFFGSGQGNALEEANDIPSAVAYNPVRMRVGGAALGFLTEFPLDPSVAPNDPTAWRPFALEYREFNDPTQDNGNPLAASLLLTHTMDDGPAPSTFVSLNVNYGLDNPSSPGGEDWVYRFLMSDNNAATQPYLDTGTPAGSFVPIYGLGVETWQRYPRFESIAFPIVENTFGYNATTGLIEAAGSQGTYALLSQDTNEFSLLHNNVGPSPTNDYLLARSAVIPHDVRVEASIYAEEGSFFVIPGPPFNPNPNDTRERFEEAVNTYGGFGTAEAIQRAQRDRLENYGTFPETPFYGEPLDVRITLVGSVAQNMPPPIDQQSHWVRRWGWIPRQIGALYDFNFDPPRPVLIPKSHVPQGYDIRPNAATPDLFVPNLTLSYDPVLATAREGGFDPSRPVIRQDSYGRTLPPMPRLPVSPTLAYFGEVNP